MHSPVQPGQHLYGRAQDRGNQDHKCNKNATNQLVCIPTSIYQGFIPTIGVGSLSYLIYEFPYKPIQRQVCEECILFIDLRSGNLFCHNLKGELIWQFSVGRGEKLLRIITCGYNRICLKSIRNEDNISKLYVLDENGEICWNTCEEWNELYISSAKDILLVNGKDLSIYNYNAKGRNTLKSNVKKNIIYANVWGNHLRMIVESRGKISVVEQDIEQCHDAGVKRYPQTEP